MPESRTRGRPPGQNDPDSPDVSVVIAVRDGAGTIRRAVDSALSQEGVAVEVVVVDDGSSDATLDVLRHTDDERLVLHRQVNRGVSAARNRGVQLAAGNVIVFLDADDHLVPGALREHHRLALEHGLACGAVEWVEGGRADRRRPSDGGAVWLPGAYAVTRRLFERVGGFDETLRYSENHELAIRLLAANDGRFGKTDSVLVVMDRTHSGSSAPHRLDAVQRILESQAAAFNADPARRSRWHGIAAVEAIRHRRPLLALRHAWRSAVAQPTRPRPWLRVLLVLTWPLATRRFRRYDRVSRRLVVHLLPRDLARGAQRHARMLCDHLDDGREHVIAVLYGKDCGVACPELSLLPEVEGRPTFSDSLRGVVRLRSMLRELRPELLVAHGSEPLKAAALAAFGTPIVYHRIGTSSDRLRNRSRRRLHRWLVRRAHLVVAVSNDVAAESIEVLQVPPDRLVVVPNGRDPSVYRRAEKAPSVVPTVGFVGHMSASKRPDLFVQIVGPLVAAGRCRGLMLGDGPLLEEVRASGEGFGIEVSGRADDVPDRLRSMDLFVFPSLREGEGLPGVLIEAAMSGLPIVTTDVPGSTEVVIDGRTGFVVAFHDPDGLRLAIERLVESDSLRNEMGLEARRHAESSLSLDASVAGWRQALATDVVRSPT